ncbi:type I-E CRISPR-associated protein Cse2/CasB [Streptomyces beigongshangae]|uniref:type I-E CRISPR-associated protein Cse2/CasB n=1 Tax=Streptomyces beigongshangae TaxID=2841597 RepID=UPI001C8488C8|nr:type I-E CRISPR-associated protein Cse2/CasB [Streptomyces sp. REN17]
MSTDTVLATPRKQIARLAATCIGQWQRGYLADQSQAVAALARLRRGAGREAGQLPDLWDLIDLGPLHEPPAGARPMSEHELVRAEDALHVAFTLWALHQQSRPQGMHQGDQPGKSRGLGAAVRQMMKPGEIDEPLRKRLIRAGTAADLTALSQRLRDIVVLLRRQDIALDYGLLAGQLYTWQWPGGADTVRREWGRSFHAWHDKPAATELPSGSGQ